jgi:hypothetical protein
MCSQLNCTTGTCATTDKGEEYCTCPNGYNLTMVDNVTGICESKYNFNISTFIDHTILQMWDRYMYIYRFTSDVGQVQQYSGVKPVNGISTLPS